MRHRSIAFALMLAGAVGPARQQAFAQARPTGRQEVVTEAPVLDGVHAQVPLRPEYHFKNEGGRDGAGLCVISSVNSDGWYQDVPEFVDAKNSKVWRLAKRKDGGYYPAKLKDPFDEAGVVTAWIQAEGSAEELVPVIKHYLDLGIPVANTMAFSQRYISPDLPTGEIHHMVQTLHLRDGLACLVDNNFPGTFLWVTEAEYGRRLVDGQAGWIVVLLWGAKGFAVVLVVAAAMFFAGGVILAGSAILVLSA